MNLEPTFILCRPSHPGNIGGSARAIKTMGLSRLELVQPKDFPSPEATARATHALDILEQANQYQTLDDAVQPYGFILGTTARSRSLNWPVYSPKEAMPHIQQALSNNEKVAILFGNERTGLENHELTKCHGLIQIPTHPDCSALNLAACVQIIAYEFAQTKNNAHPTQIAREANATQDEMARFYLHLQELLSEINFFTAHNPEHVMAKMMCLLNRGNPKKSEIAMFRGILSQLQFAINNSQKDKS